MASCELGSRLSPHSVNTLICLAVSRTMRNKYCLNHQVCGIFVTGVQQTKRVLLIQPNQSPISAFSSSWWLRRLWRSGWYPPPTMLGAYIQCSVKSDVTPPSAVQCPHPGGHLCSFSPIFMVLASYIFFSFFWNVYCRFNGVSGNNGDKHMHSICWV